LKFRSGNDDNAARGVAENEVPRRNGDIRDSNGNIDRMGFCFSASSYGGSSFGPDLEKSQRVSALSSKSEKVAKLSEAKESWAATKKGGGSDKA
jgi:hypothetical protein